MRRDEAAVLLPAPAVMHVVGRVTDEVFSFLGPATQALSASGVAQLIVLIDDPTYRHHLPRLAAVADMVLIPPRRNPAAQWKTVQQACAEALRKTPCRALHLHGLLPCLAGTWAAQSTSTTSPRFYSPHASHSLGQWRWVGSVLSWLMRPWVRPGRNAAIVNMPAEARSLEEWKSVDLVESAVGDDFFSTPRNEARHPLIVTGGRTQSAIGAEMFTQLAVLMGGEDLQVAFNWIGTVDDVSKQRLNAAGVGVFDITEDAEVAQRLAAGWMYVAAGGTRGFPLFLAEAMACGMPCLAINTPQHRHMLRHGETGLLYETEQELIDHVARLIDEPAWRAQLGQAAQQEALRRFSAPAFSSRLLAAYAAPA